MRGAVIMAAAAGPACPDIEALDGLILAAPAVRGHQSLNPIYRAALWAGEDLLDPWLTGTMFQRYLALALLVGAGVALYGLASFVTGAYRLSDIKALMRRKNAN